MNVKGKSSKELKEVVAQLSEKNKELEIKLKSLGCKLSSTETKVKVVTRQRTKTESFSEYRKRLIAKDYVKYILMKR
jgi:regulator of replication initiation timing